MTRVLSAFLLLIFATSTVSAGDIASFRTIGFSEDSKYFAFEEYGIQDGSGFPYSTIFVINLEKDSWVPGSPFKAQLNDEREPLSAARQKAAMLATQTLTDLKMSQPALALYHRGIGEVRNSIGKVDVFYPNRTDPIAEPWDQFTLNLTEFPIAGDMNNCPDPEGTKGFRLSLTSGAQTSLLHEDTRLPKSRGCPHNYRLSAVYTPEFSGKSGPSIAILSMFKFGFEGRDRRFLAISLPKTQN